MRVCFIILIFRNLPRITLPRRSPQPILPHKGLLGLHPLIGVMIVVRLGTGGITVRKGESWIFVQGNIWDDKLQYFVYNLSHICIRCLGTEHSYSDCPYIANVCVKCKDNKLGQIATGHLRFVLFYSLKSYHYFSFLARCITRRIEGVRSISPVSFLLQFLRIGFQRGSTVTSWLRESVFFVNTLL